MSPRISGCLLFALLAFAGNAPAAPLSAAMLTDSGTLSFSVQGSGHCTTFDSPPDGGGIYESLYTEGSTSWSTNCSEASSIPQQFAISGTYRSGSGVLVLPPVRGSYGLSSSSYSYVVSNLRFTVPDSQELLFSYEYAFSAAVSATSIFGQLPDGKYYGTFGDSSVLARLGLNICPYSAGIQQCRPGTETVFMPWDIVSRCVIDFDSPDFPYACDDSQNGTRSGSDIRLAGSGDWFVSVAWGSSATSASHVNTVPEPGTFFLVGLGFAVLGFHVRALNLRGLIGNSLHMDVSSSDSDPRSTT